MQWAFTIHIYICTKKTYYFNHETEVWTYGPDLNIGRRGHKAGLVKDHSVTGKTELYVFGGFDGKNYLDSTEILRDGKWVMGKDIFYYSEVLFQHNKKNRISP